MISCVVTLYNEQSSIESLLEALSEQTKIIDEIILVDAHSSDRTVHIIKNFIVRKKMKSIRLLSKKGNRSKGRNFGIEKSHGDKILVTDAGCVPNKNWAKLLSEALGKNADVVSGFYYSGARTPFKKALASYTCVMIDKIDKKNFLPSSRSIGFKKSAWKNAGGYPEELDTCEDLVFAKNLKKEGLVFYFEKKAYVIWPQKDNLFQAFAQLYGYAKGDGQAFFIRSQTPFLFGRYTVGVFLLSLSIVYESNILLGFLIVGLGAYLFWAIVKNQKYVNSPLGYAYLPLLQLTSDAAVLLGMTSGFLSRVNRKYFT